MVAPGLRYLGRYLHRLITPVIATVLLLSYLEIRTPTLHTSWPIKAWLGLLSIPLAFAVQLQYRDYLNRRAAIRLHAVIPPRVGDPTPGGLRTVMSIAKSFAVGQYIGDYLLPCSTYFGRSDRRR